MTTPRFKLLAKWYEPPIYNVFTDDGMDLGILQRDNSGWYFETTVETVLLCESDQDPYVAQLCVRAYLKGRGL